MGAVPEQELQRCFDRAFAGHDSSFPISAYDMKTAYDAIVADERELENRKREERRRKLEAITTEPKYRICEHCHSGGFREVFNRKDPDNTYVVKCNQCNYWEIRKP